ncbi:MAG: hypothetical protein ACKVW3_05110 [Phycisphaerales bacterium]
MFAKLVAVVLAVCVGACALLVIRHLRTQAAHELAESRLRLQQRDNDLWRIKARIAAAVTPSRVQQMASRLGTFKPLAADLPPMEMPGRLVEGPR